MANALALQTLEDGPRNAVIKVTLVNDTSNTAATVIADPALLTPISNQLNVAEIQYNVQDGWYVTLFWQATTPKVMVTLAGRGSFPVGRNFGGFQNDSTTGKTGRITLTTTGYTSGTMVATLVLNVIKQVV